MGFHRTIKTGIRSDCTASVNSVQLLRCAKDDHEPRAADGPVRCERRENLPQKHSPCPEQQPAVTRLLPAHTLRDQSRATRSRLHARQPRASIISAEALFISADRLRCEAAQMLRWHSAGGLQDVSRVDNEQLGEEDADYVEHPGDTVLNAGAKDVEARGNEDALLDKSPSGEQLKWFVKPQPESIEMGQSACHMQQQSCTAIVRPEHSRQVSPGSARRAGAVVDPQPLLGNGGGAGSRKVAQRT
ncbi:hypothetical protein Anapl_11419 [Anas platyrhynchos]|uniref:Uncharacterized protein n=1 Tax=Anas platyrhynchos TaxID=8839 RepID=R0L908_ANAPL|nr:hypothetical protein Anapl_11419 [Anas platyrhynchos]